jgi:hypothetical protein
MMGAHGGWLLSGVDGNAAMGDTPVSLVSKALVRAPSTTVRLVTPYGDEFQ